MIEGVDLVSRIGAFLNLAIHVLPWVAVVVLLVIVFNPGGYGDKWLEALRGVAKSAKEAVDEQSREIAELKRDVSEIKSAIVTIAESAKAK